MLGSTSGRFQTVAKLAGIALLVGGIAACANPTTPPAQSQSENQAISEVRVDRDGAATVVTLMGLDRPVFTAFAQPNPDRVIVDLVSHPDELIEPIAVNDGLVKSVAFSPYSTGVGGELTRVEVTLYSPSDFTVDAVPEGLAIRVLARAGELAPSLDNESMEEAEAFDPWAVDSAESSELTPQSDSAESVTEAAADEATPAAAAEALPATALTGIEVTSIEDGVLIQLHSNGTIGSVVSFTLEDPARLVIDLQELSSEASQNVIEVGSARVERIRVGDHGDKVRVVVDGGDSDDPFDGRRVVPTSAGLLVALGQSEKLDTALDMAAAIAEVVQTASAQTPSEEPEAEVAEVEVADVEPASFDEGSTGSMGEASSEPSEDPWETAAAELSAEDTSVSEVDTIEVIESAPAEAAEEATPSMVSIYGIEYDAQDGRDRIVVLADAAVDYNLYEPTPETLVISMVGARIDPEAAVRITPEPGGPISLVTAFEQPELEIPEVRLVVQRATNLSPEVSRRGSLLIIDFPHTGAVAAAPPAIADLAKISEAGAEAMSSAAAATSSPDTGEAQDSVPAAIPSTSESVETAASAVAESDILLDTMPAAAEPGASIDVLQPGGLSAAKQYSGRRISLDFKDVDVSDVLRLIAEVSELNVIAGDEVKGKVTIRLVDVPWDQALDVVLLTKGLGFMRIGNVLRIAPSAVIAQEEEMRMQERRVKEKLEDLVVKLQPVNYADVTQISSMVASLLTPGRGTVTTDERTSTLIIKDIPSVIDEATALIKAIDTQTPQVMIEAKIVEASLDFKREFGASWGVGAQPLVDAYDPGSAARQDLGSDMVRFHNSEGSTFFGNNAVFSNPITAFPSGLFNLAAFLLDEKLNLELQLQAAEVNGDGKVISSPRLVTLDNKKASIQQGVSIPFQKLENGDPQLEFVDAVLKLEVTPHITANKSIIMKITVTRNAPDDSVFTLTGSPAIAKNEVKTETLVKDGQTLVLGGIYVIVKSNRASSIPYLSRIPLLGAAFRSDEINESRKELLIFVTPRIVMPVSEDV